MYFHASHNMKLEKSRAHVGRLAGTDVHVLLGLECVSFASFG